MDEIEIPSHFLCPISLHLMRDPVTVCTGITYDRENIERWLFSCKSNICPVTKQSLLFTDLTPNHTLHRLIQSWCTLHASFGIELIPTPKPPVDKTQILKLLSQAKRSPEYQLQCLRRLRSLVFESERNKTSLEAAGAAEFLASTMNNNSSEDSDTEMESAIEILFHLNPSPSQIKKLVNYESIQYIESLVQILGVGNFQSRAYATALLKSALEVADPTQLVSVRTELFVEITRVLRDRISQQASKAALKLLVELCPWGRNRIKAVQGGTVFALVELLVDAAERRACELILTVLDQLCGCAEGRAELLKHGAGLAIVSKKILSVSHVASGRGVKILTSICRYSANCWVLQEMLQAGAVSKLCLVIEVEGSCKTKERAKEILKLHSRVWKNSQCFPVSLLPSYPSD